MSGLCEKLQTFADGELAVAERPAFHRHLATCTACQRALESALMLDALAATFSEGPAGLGDDRPGSSAPAALPPSGR
jgi:anti-sigma factor RsiW